MTTAQAHTNIALIKYWGKRSVALKLPMNSSISLTLDQLYTTTTVTLQPHLTTDVLQLNGQVANASQTTKIQSFMAQLRQQYHCEGYVHIDSVNHFPTGAGLASSASGFAALALAASQAYGLELSPPELSRLARVGSGSACRSIWGGWVEWLRGERDDGLDSFAISLPVSPSLQVSMLVLVIENKPKATGSTDGMAHCVETSPYYPAWQATVESDLVAMRQALKMGDLATIGQIMEHNCLKMHATTMTAQPAVWYWYPQTLRLLQHVYQLREQGLSAYFTIDAGPNVKILCDNKDRTFLTDYFQGLPEVKQVFACLPGPAAHVLA